MGHLPDNPEQVSARPVRGDPPPPAALPLPPDDPRFEGTFRRDLDMRNTWGKNPSYYFLMVLGILCIAALVVALDNMDRLIPLTGSGTGNGPGRTSKVPPPPARNAP
jgi:hypothetical protein